MPTKVSSFILVTKFIEIHQLPLELAKSVLRNEDDCEEFHNDFYQTNKRVADDLLDFREHKIETADVSVGEFIQRCTESGGLMKAVFEEIFVQSFDDSDIGVILSAVISRKTSLEEIFLNFKENPNKNILQYVL